VIAFHRCQTQPSHFLVFSTMHRLCSTVAAAPRRCTRALSTVLSNTHHPSSAVNGASAVAAAASSPAAAAVTHTATATAPVTPSPFEPAAPAAPFTAPPQPTATAAATPHKQHTHGQQTPRLRHSHYDITIVGGGMVGSALALALASSPVTRHLKVCLLEFKPPNLSAPLRGGPSIRVSAVAPASAAFFQRLGAWDLMRSKRVSMFDRMIVWHTMERGRVDWNMKEMRGQSHRRADTPMDSSQSHNEEEDALGYIVENDIIQTSLWQRMHEVLNASERETHQSLTRLQEGGETSSAAQQTTASITCNLEILAPIQVEQILPGENTTASHQTSSSSASSHSSAAGGSSWPRLLLSNEQAISTRLLIGADGPNSIVKKYASGNISSYGWDYPSRAVVAAVKVEPTYTSTGQQVPNRIAFQRFLPTGPLAFLPCHEDYASLVWSTTPAHAKQLCAEMTSEEFVEAVNKAFRADSAQFQPGGRRSFFDPVLPGPLSQVASILFPTSQPPFPPLITSVAGPRASFPLRYIHADRYIAPRVALLGDAAHVIHPLAGQGVNLGFGDAECLAHEIEQAVLDGSDLGEVVALQNYDRTRRRTNKTMMGAIHSLREVFNVPSGPFAAARAMGLDLFNAMPAVKKQAAVFAMGLKLDQTR